MRVGRRKTKIEKSNHRHRNSRHFMRIGRKKIKFGKLSGEKISWQVMQTEKRETGKLSAGNQILRLTM